MQNKRNAGTFVPAFRFMGQRFCDTEDEKEANDMAYGDDWGNNESVTGDPCHKPGESAPSGCGSVILAIAVILWFLSVCIDFTH